MILLYLLLDRVLAFYNFTFLSLSDLSEELLEDDSKEFSDFLRSLNTLLFRFFLYLSLLSNDIDLCSIANSWTTGPSLFFTLSVSDFFISRNSSSTTLTEIYRLAPALITWPPIFSFFSSALGGLKVKILGISSVAFPPSSWAFRYSRSLTSYMSGRYLPSSSSSSRIVWSLSM